MAKAAQRERVHCNKCRTKTLHTALKTVVEKDSEYVEEMEDDLRWTTTFEMMQCLGCREIVLRRTVNWEAEITPQVNYFPPATSRNLPKWQFRVPQQLRRLLTEIYRSLDADTHSLPLMGARALLDLVMVEKVGDVGSFQSKLKELEKAGYVSVRNREVLDAALDAGSAAAHRGHAATAEEIHTVMDIVENLIQSVYVLEHAAQSLKKTAPPRPSRKTP
jgi:hypothetical protein